MGILIVLLLTHCKTVAVLLMVVSLIFTVLIYVLLLQFDLKELHNSFIVSAVEKVYNICL